MRYFKDNKNILDTGNFWHVLLKNILGDPCIGHMCQNGGDCDGYSALPESSVAYYVCVCQPEYTGK